MANSTSRSQSSKPLRVAVLGCGKLAREVLLPTVTRIPEVTVSAIADLDPAACTAGASVVPGATAYAVWRDAIAHDVDAVVVALPTAMHAEAAIAVMEAGRHLYLEKPVAASVEEGALVVQAAGRVGLGWAGLKSRPHNEQAGPPNEESRPHAAPAAMVGFNYRFNPLIVELRRRLRQGLVGKPRAIRTVFSTKAMPGATWRRPDAPGGGVLLDLGSHHVDLVRHITGDEIVAVHAERVGSPDGAERVTLEMRLGGGAVVQSVFATGSEDVDRIEVEGERGSLTVDRYRSWVVQRHAPGAPSPASRLREIGGWRYALEKHRSPWHEPSFARSLGAFVAAVRGAEQQGARLEDGLRSLKTIAAAERSCAERRVVEIHEAAAASHGPRTPSE